MLEKGAIDTDLVPGPVDYAMLRAGTGPRSDLPIVLWLHGGGGSCRFLETCQAQFATCWTEGSLPDLAAVTPSAGWSLYLDRLDGSAQWETFLLDELVPAVRKQTGSVTGRLVVGGISGGALGALRIAFKRPELVTAVLAVEPTIEAALRAADVPLRDRVQLPERQRKQLYGDPIDGDYWQANHPPYLANRNGPAIAAARMAIYLECGDADLLHAQYGAELLHRILFDQGITHEYRQTQGGNHVGPTVGPRLVEAIRFLGRALKNGTAVGAGAVGGAVSAGGVGTAERAEVGSLIEVETFAARVRDLEQTAGYRQQHEVRGPACQLTVHAQGEGRRVVLLPSLGRGASDFAELADRLARGGYRVLRPEPRGLTGSSRSLDGLTLDDFADDVAAVIGAYGGPATLVGHDFGGQVAQMVAYLHPDLVSSLVLLATPGPIQAKPEPATALRRIFVPELSDPEHLEAVAVALFAEGNDPVAWVDGWYPLVAFAQAEAERQVPIEDLWARLRVEALVLQPADDVIVMPENAELMAEQLGDLVTVITIPRAGHALLPEQPEAVATAILSWLRVHR